MEPVASCPLTSASKCSFRNHVTSDEARDGQSRGWFLGPNVEHVELTAGTNTLPSPPGVFSSHLPFPVHFFWSWFREVPHCARLSSYGISVYLLVQGYFGMYSRSAGMWLWASCSSARCPYPWQGCWNWMIFKVPFNQNHSMIVWHLEITCDEKFNRPFNVICERNLNDRKNKHLSVKLET